MDMDGDLGGAQLFNLACLRLDHHHQRTGRDRHLQPLFLGWIGLMVSHPEQSICYFDFDVQSPNGFGQLPNSIKGEDEEEHKDEIAVDEVVKKP